jgi:hypothetical protein
VASLNITKGIVTVMDTIVSVSADQVEALCHLCQRNAVEYHKLVAATGIMIGIAMNMVLASGVNFSSSLRSPMNITHQGYLVK